MEFTSYELYGASDVMTLKTWLERFLKADGGLRDFRTKGLENYKLYKSYKEGKMSIYKHNIFVPYSFAFVEDLAAYYMLSIMAAPNIFTIEPRYNSVSMDLSKAVEILVNWALEDERTEFVLEFEELLKNLSIYSVAYLINFPMTEPVGQTNPGVETYSHLFLDSPHPFTIYPEPGAKRLSRARWVIKQSFETYENLKDWERKGIYQNVDAIRGDRTSEINPVEEALQSIGLHGMEFNQDRIELLDCFEDGDVVTIANRRAIIRDTRNDQLKAYSFDLPILDCRLGGAPGEFIGVGSVEAIKPTQKELNLLRSQRRDNVALVLNKLFIYDMLSGEVDLSTLFSAPGNVILTQGDAVKELPISDVTASSFSEEEKLIYDIQNVLSFWDYSRGATPRRRETATGIIRLQQASQSRNEWYLRKIDAYVLQPLCKRLIVYLRESLPESDAVDIVGESMRPAIEQFYQLSSEQLKRLLAVKPMTESLSSIKELEMNNFLLAFDRLVQLPGVNLPALAKLLLQKLGQKNIDEILGSLSPAAQDLTQMGMQQLAEQPPLPGMQPGQMTLPPLPGLEGLQGL